MLEYIQEQNVWDILSAVRKPIVMYGMGNGADKLFSILDGLQIKVSDIFASDEFVRGHSFHGYKVLKYSEVCEKYDDFIIVMSFAVHDEPTLRRIREMDKSHPVLAPDMPVAGSGLFTKKFIREYEKEFDFAFSRLEDEQSRSAYVDILNFKISGKIEYLFRAQTNKDEVYTNILKLGPDESIVDLGAYDGDTIRELVAAANGTYREITALEPDSRNFKKLEKNTAGMQNLTLLNMGAWDKPDTLMFSRKAGRSSRFASGGIPVAVNSVDNILSHPVTLLKMDIEGSEMRAIRGASRTIAAYLPKLYLCAYHRNEDMFAIPLAIHEISQQYQLFFRHHPYIPAWESNFYAVLK